MLELLWLIPLLPLAGAAVNAALGPRVGRPLTTAVALLAPGASLVLGLSVLAEYARSLHPSPVESVLYTWTAGDLAIDVAFLLDPLSAVMLFVVTFVGFFIHVYSAGYMAGEGGYQRYFVYLNLFMAMMLLLVLGNNFLVTFVGWEGVGLCSYLLIGYHYDREEAARAGRKAFVVNRIGDFAFLVGMFTLVATFGTLDYGALFALIQADSTALLAPYALGLSLAGFLALCLFVAATGKSAQIPLFVWLPDAMAGPTPVSALIHAATMVTAGVYLLARTSAIFRLAPEVLQLVTGVAAATAFLAATIALAQTDIKKVLAYSTVSQLGFMFIAAGCGAFGVAIFHLATHAFFKALLFLGSGSVIHALGGEQDLRRMGGLRKALPQTHLTFLIGTLAIAGVPFLSGFFSKDAILAAAWEANRWIWGLALLTAALTAFYMFRLYFLCFGGEFRGTDEQRQHLHESPLSMTLPLWVLAVGSVIAGYGGAIPFLHRDWLGDWLAPALAGAGHGSAPHEGNLEMSLVGASVFAAAAGLFLAWRLFGRERGLAGGEAVAGRWPRLHSILVAKYRIDEIYEATILRPLRGLAQACWKIVDTLLIDGAIHVGAFVVELTGDLGRYSTTGKVRNYALTFFAGVLFLFWIVF